MGEIRYTCPRYRMEWQCGVGYDYGDIYKHSLGVQLSVKKHFSVTPAKKR
jgi:hypothetical protein